VKTGTGNGVRALKSFAEYEYLFDYVGEYIDMEMLNKRYKYGCKRYSIELIKNKRYIDAEVYGNTARYLNHSCDPNCIARRVNFGSDPKMAIFTCRPISFEEELTFNYASE
jgi:SET domain-containing protein